MGTMCEVGENSCTVRIDEFIIVFRIIEGKLRWVSKANVNGGRTYIPDDKFGKACQIAGRQLRHHDQHHAS